MITTKVREVQIYRSRCTVIREGKVLLKKGNNSIEIAGMSTGTLIDTVKMKFPSFVKASAIRVIEGRTGEKTKELSRRIQRIDAKKETLRAQAAMWKSDANFSSLKDLSIKDLEAYIKAYPLRIDEIETKIQELEDEKEVLQKELNKTVNEERRPYVKAELFSEQDAECPFEIIYQDTLAGWRPKYEIHTDGVNSEVEFHVKADINQNTLEDWNQVKIHLRTGNPAYFSAAPKQYPVYLDLKSERIEPPVLSKSIWGDDVDNAFGLEDTFGSTASLTLRSLPMDNAVFNTEETMTEYVLPEVYNVPSGYGEGLSAELNQFHVKAIYVKKALPKQSKAVYISADIKTEDIPFVVCGNADIYLNGIYTANVRLDHDRTEEVFSIPLGIAERISVSRSEHKKKASEAMIRNQKSCIYEITIQAANHEKDEISLEVMDQIPVSRDQAITVELLNCSNAPKFDQESGELKWNLNLKSQQTETLQVEYRVHWPKDRQIEIIDDYLPFTNPPVFDDIDW